MPATTVDARLVQYPVGVTGGTTPTDLFIRDVPDWTPLLKRTDTPFLKLVGGLSGGAPSVPMLKSEWGWGSPDPMEDTLAEDLDNSETVITVSNGAYYQAGLIFQIANEDFYVESKSGNDITVSTRGYRGTTPATHSNGAAIHFTGIAIAEGANDPLSVITQGELDYNYSEIIIFNWQMSERAKVTPTYESRNFSGNRFEQELKKKMNKTAPVYLERMLLAGLRSQGNGSGVASTMGGLRQPSYITTRNTVPAVGPLTELAFMDTSQDLYDLVGLDDMSRTIMCGSLGKRIVNSWYNDTRRTSGSDTKINVNFDTIRTDFGDFKFVINYQLDRLGRSDEMYWLNPDQIKLRPYASSTGWKTGMLATDGWYDRGFLRADVTSIWENPDARAALTAWSIDETDYPNLS